MFAIAVCILLISVNGVPKIWYNSIVSAAVWLAAVEPPTPLVKDDNVVLDNEPVIISLLIYPVITNKL